MFRSVAIALSLFVLSSTSAVADTASHRESAEELLVLMNVPASLDQIDAIFGQAMSQAFAASEPPPEAQPVLQKYLGKMSEIMSDEFSWDKMKDLYIDLYVEEFTEPQLDELAEFFATPIGRMYTGKTPELMRKASDRAQGRMATMQTRIQSLMQEMLAELETVK